MLVQHGRLAAPLLYLSAYLERDRAHYYEALQAVRERGDALPWIELFLTAVRSQAQDAVLHAHVSSHSARTTAPRLPLSLPTTR